jgi:hypothetical protein
MDLQMPADFPHATYMAVEARISHHLAAHKPGVDAGTIPGFSGYAGGWNGLAIRFRASDEYGASAIHLLTTLPGSPPNEDRYAQERDLFGFFANAVAAVESCCFAIYHLGLMAQPRFFTKLSDEVDWKDTTTSVADAFGGSRLDQVLARLRGDAAWRDIRDVRNMLVHRASSPGRTVYAATAEAVAAGYVVPPAEWTGLGIALDRSLVEPHRVWLGQTVERLIGATDDFMSRELPDGK